MEKPLKITDEILLDYIDNQLDDGQMAAVENACKEPKWQSRLDELRQINHLLALEELAEPNKDFAARVMFNLDKPLQTSLSIKKSGIILLILTLCTVILGSIYMTEGSVTFDFTDSVGMDRFNHILNLSKIDLPNTINLQWITDGLLFVLLMVSLLLLDRMILRPFFKNRKTQVHY